MCRSRRELSNAYFLANFYFDTAENEPCKVCPIEQCKQSLARYGLAVYLHDPNYEKQPTLVERGLAEFKSFLFRS